MKLSGWAIPRRSAVLVLVAGLVVTATAVHIAGVDDRNLRAADLDRQGTMVIGLLEETLELAESKVRSVQAFLHASTSVTTVEFSRFARYQRGSPGMVYMGFARIVTEDEWSEFTETARRERPQYVVLDSNRRPLPGPPSGRDAVPVWLGEQPTSIPTIVGVDLAEDEARREAITRSLDSRVPSLTRLPTLLGGDDENYYVELYAPVRDDAAGGPGVAFITIDVFALVDEASRGPLAGTSVEIHDVTGSTERLPPSGPDQWNRLMAAADRTWQISLVSEDPDQPAPLVVTVLVAGLAISVLGATVTQTVGASRRRRRELEELRATTRAKDLFLASVAHELRTPLTSVVGMTALLSEGWQSMERSEIEELLGTAHSEASELGGLIDDLLIAGRLQAGAIHYRFEPVDLGLEVRRVLSRVTNTASVTVDLPEEGPSVHADPLRVRQIVRNIVVNGFRYATSELRVGASVEEGQVVLTIRNDGPPIPAELEEVLFHPYQEGRDRPIMKGSIGLGLPVSKTLAQAMGGDLGYSYIQGWCVFTIRLPAWRDADRRATSDTRV